MKSAAFLLLLNFLFDLVGGDVHSTCYLRPAETGNCYASLRRFSYFWNLNKCLEFIYGGCGDKGNNFKTKELCVATCVHGINEKIPY